VLKKGHAEVWSEKFCIEHVERIKAATASA